MTWTKGRRSTNWATQTPHKINIFLKMEYGSWLTRANCKIFGNFGFFLKILFIYSWETRRERQRQAEGAAGSMQGARLNPGTAGSHPGPKAGTQLLSHLGIPYSVILKELLTTGTFTLALMEVFILQKPGILHVRIVLFFFSPESRFNRTYIYHPATAE